jgi:hypothetical protein
MQVKNVGLVFWFSVVLTACGADDPAREDTQTGVGSDLDSDPNVEVNSDGVSAGLSWQWQLSGDINTGYEVALYDIDLFDTTQSSINGLQAQGRLVICYFSAGSWEEWRDDAEDFDTSVLGNALDGWEGERWLDIRADSLHEIMEARLDTAVAKGCDGVEPDNIDGYINESGFDLSGSDQITYNQFLATAAHERGLMIGLKNDLDQIEALVDSFDFAVNEECYEYEECELLSPFIDAGKAVLHAEYSQQLKSDSAARSEFCAEMNELGFSSLVLPLELDDSFRFSCQ